MSVTTANLVVLGQPVSAGVLGILYVVGLKQD